MSESWDSGGRKNHKRTTASRQKEQPRIPVVPLLRGQGSDNAHWTEPQ